jgi:hypothetical protein
MNARQLRLASRSYDNPTLMRLREREVLEKISTASAMKVMFGENGLADRVINLS